MAITLNGTCFDYRGLSTDKKPEGAAVNSIFLELDTNKFFAYDGETWIEIGGTEN